MQSESRALECSDKELYYLGLLVWGESLLGVADPFPGWLAGEIEEALVDAEETLEERGLITIQPDGVVVPNDETSILVSTVARCELACIVTRSVSPDEDRQRLFYFRHPTLVELVATPAEGQSNHYTILPLDSHPTPLFDQVVSFWELAAQTAPTGSTTMVQDRTLADTRQIAAESGAEAASRHLVGEGVAHGTAQALGETLATASQNGALALMRRGGQGWKTGGLGLLEGTNGLWMLRSRNQGELGMVECVPCTAAVFAGELQKCIERFLNE